VLYTGVTSDLKKRVGQHKDKEFQGFTSRYNVDKLVYFKAFIHAKDAIAEEKRIKAGSRVQKIKLVRSKNRQWEDLATNL